MNTRYEISEFCRGHERIDPPEESGRDIDRIKRVLAGSEGTDGHGNNFSEMWDSPAMDFLQEELFADADRCADMLKLISEHAHEYPLLASSLDELAQRIGRDL